MHCLYSETSCFFGSLPVVRRQPMKHGEPIGQLIGRLSEARSICAALKQAFFRQDRPGQEEINTTQDMIMAIEKDARAMIRTLGCTSPESRLIFRETSDMLIQWYAFTDELD